MPATRNTLTRDQLSSDMANSVYKTRLQRIMVVVFVKANIKSNMSDIIIGLRSDTLSSTNQYFYFLGARYYIWSCKTKEILPKIERFPGFLSSLVPSYLFLFNNNKKKVQHDK